MRGLTLHRRAIHAVLAMFALVGAFVLMTAPPARAGENTFVEVTPNSAQAGTRLTVRANCDNANNQQATVHSDAFGRVVLRPEAGSSPARSPSRATSRPVTIRWTCGAPTATPPRPC